VQLLAVRRFETGATLQIELPEDQSRQTYSVLATVIHVNPAQDGCWALGCKFFCELTPDELQRLLPDSCPQHL
jgi:hypothetical protein